jgi:hypothetical protein
MGVGTSFLLCNSCLILNLIQCTSCLWARCHRSQAQVPHTQSQSSQLNLGGGGSSHIHSQQIN